MELSKSDILAAVTELVSDTLNKQFIPGKSTVPATSPLLTPEDIANVVDTVLGCWFTEWKQASKFRQSLSELTNRNHVSLVNSGSSANLVAMLAAKEQLGKDDREFVLTTALAFPTTVAPIYQAGYIPLYVDVIYNTMMPDVVQISKAIEMAGSSIAGAIFAHTLGFPYNEAEVRDILGPNRFFISDCCDALGAEYYDGEWKKVGSDADLSTLSFFPAHHITSGEGGAVMCDLDSLHDVCQSLINWGRSCVCQPGQTNVCGQRFSWPTDSLPAGWDHKYIFDRLGYNLKMTDIQAALGYSQSLKVPEFASYRLDNLEKLTQELSDIQQISPICVPSWSNPSPFGYPIYCDDGVDVNHLIQYLQHHHIETRRVFAGNITHQPGYADLAYDFADYESGAPLKSTDAIMNHVFWIGCGPFMTNVMIEYVSDIFHKYFRN